MRSWLIQRGSTERRGWMCSENHPPMPCMSSNAFIEHILGAWRFKSRSMTRRPTQNRGRSRNRPDCCPTRSWSSSYAVRTMLSDRSEKGCHCASGWICEQHPDQPWPHDDCAGRGKQCRNPHCPFWQGPLPAALSMDRWAHLYASIRYAFQVVQPWGPNKALQATVISEHVTAADAFREIDRLGAEMAKSICSSPGVRCLVDGFRTRKGRL